MSEEIGPDTVLVSPEWREEAEAELGAKIVDFHPATGFRHIDSGDTVVVLELDSHPRFIIQGSRVRDHQKPLALERALANGLVERVVENVGEVAAGEPE